ncbi:MAG: UDP-N-acetylglucosamine 1-carboxyvinyltransferase [Ignavibacteria bacterium]|nr:UDP-N-acetylglucosamine 1-carboxyvinyltransferase [Ignavibacteria bacterium]
MEKFVITGGKKLKGKVRISGAKNAILAMMPATILASGVYRFQNVPNLRDVWTMSRLLIDMGIYSELNDGELFVNSHEIKSFEAPYEHVKKMRASFYVLGPLVSRFGKAKVSLPGGCAWGPRPVDLHLKGLEKLGADIDIEGGYVIAKTNKLIGTRIHLDIPSVGATGNLLMAAVLAKGTTVISNAAIEPEITALAKFLVKMGARIDGIGTNMLEIEGVDDLHPANELIIPDRIEAGTMLIAGAITEGNVTIENCNPYHITAVISKMEEAGCEFDICENKITVRMEGPPKPVDITTAVYPGFPTDMQSQWVAFMLKSNGVSKITETIYPDRFKHVPELQRLGAQIEMSENTAIVYGGKKLSGATVMGSDLRGSAALVLGALIAEGTTEILRIYHLDRGYESLDKKLRELGAEIWREQTEEY